MHLGADVDDAGLVEILEAFLADVRDVAGDFLRPQLGVAGHHLEFLDVDRGEDIVLGDPLGDQDRIRSEEHTSELQSLMRNSYAVFCLKKKKTTYRRYKSTKNK